MIIWIPVAVMRLPVTAVTIDKILLKNAATIMNTITAKIREYIQFSK